ncbi:hypothetical protein [Azospirillum picis]|uniref:DUF2946 domain-containing protein n=1 Tax=Azospirillum picis TaxID=488438 RepID=A0ABU0MTB4_9PROT|nr:hypothetical protein [Azospirillum picis]MBP2302972.1 hypothetical protein [Azospirillum picis]MDQ0536724.1 hypothetical protein [Azospirillum picis]
MGVWKWLRRMAAADGRTAPALLAAALLAAVLLWSGGASADCPHGDMPPSTTSWTAMPAAMPAAGPMQAAHCAGDEHRHADSPCCGWMACGTMHVGLIGLEPLPIPRFAKAPLCHADLRLQKGLESRPALPPPRRA